MILRTAGTDGSTMYVDDTGLSCSSLQNKLQDKRCDRGVVWWINGQRWEATDNAFVEADTTLVMHCVPSVYELTAAPDDIDFGTKTVGYSTVAAQTVTVTNTGNDWLLLAQPEAENYVISQID